MKNVLISVTPYEAIELIKWRNTLRKAVDEKNTEGFIYKTTINNALDSVFREAEKGVLQHATIWNTPPEKVKAIDQAFKAQ